VIYHEGWGVPQDYAEAVKWYRTSAEQGDASAQNRLEVDKGIGAILELKGGTWVSLEDITEVLLEMPEYAVREGKPVRVR
jgi:TPR repeat protein